MNKENDYAYFSESLHSSYLFFTMEVDKLSKENKRLREALESIAKCNYSDKKATNLEWCKKTAKQALGE